MTENSAYEIVAGTHYPNTQVKRLPVPGGWIYYFEPTHREPCAVFVPFPAMAAGK